MTGVKSRAGADWRIAAVVILYHPPRDIRDIIATYLSDVSVLYAIDNTESPHPVVAQSLSGEEKIVYLPNRANLGVARALNQAAELAVAEGFDLLLTMDQDSRVTPGMMDQMMACFAGDTEERIAVVSPSHKTGGKRKGRPVGTCAEVLTAMTSGNLLRLSAYRAAGPFREELFIDYVDHEYCLRLHSLGYRVVEATGALLLHPLGALQSRRLLGRTVYSSGHPPLRRYYMNRNRLLLMGEYGGRFPTYRRFLLRQILSEIVLLLLCEERRWAKIRMIIRGFFDYYRGRFGCYAGGE